MNSKAKIYVSMIIISILSISGLYTNCSEQNFVSLKGINFSFDEEGAQSEEVVVKDLSNLVKITNKNTVTFTGLCDPLYPIKVNGADSILVCSSDGLWSYTSPEIKQDGKHEFIFSQVREQGVDTVQSDIKATWYRDTTPPTVESVIINDGKSFSGRPVMQVKANVKDNLDFLRKSKGLQIQEADLVSLNCEGQFKEFAFAPYSGPNVDHSAFVSIFTGNKKLCVWAMDFAGNISKISNVGIKSVNFDDIDFELGTIPFFKLFYANNKNSTSKMDQLTVKKGDLVSVNFTVGDIEGLAASPIDLFYTTNGSDWVTITKGLGPSSEGEKSYAGSFDFAAPVNGFFRIKAVATDKSGNTSFENLSAAFNTDRWQVFTGNASHGIGLSALSTTLYKNSYSGAAIAVDPSTLDIYTISDNKGLLRFDARTGLSELIIKYGTTLLNDGPLANNSRIQTYAIAIKFAPNGNLYIRVGGEYRKSAKFYSLDVKTKELTYLFGGGLQNDTGASPTDVNVALGGFDFDESGDLYFNTSCTPGTWDMENYPEIRLLKMEMNSNHPVAVTRIAGTCNTNPSLKYAFGSKATDSPYFRNRYAMNLTDLAVWGEGKYIYTTFYGGAPIKIVDGIIHETKLPSSYRGVHYSKVRKSLIFAGGGLYQVNPVLSAGADIATQLVNSTFKAGCVNDSVLASEACIISSGYTGITETPQGFVIFGDGAKINSVSKYRVRFLAPDQKIYSIAGSLPFYGDKKDKSVIRGALSGIHYKKSSDPNQSAFPAGLYFLDRDAVLFGHINPKTSKVEVLGGDQSRMGSNIIQLDGKSLTKEINFSRPYAGGDMHSLAFDDDGLPWFRANMRLVRVDKNKKIQIDQKGSKYWHDAKDGDKASQLRLHPYGGKLNFSLKGQGLFLMGGYYLSYAPSLIHVRPSLKFLDYSNDLVTHIMGGVGFNHTSDILTPSSLKNESLSRSCLSSNCPTAYDKINDKLYFIEGKSIRYIDQPNSNSSMLQTLTLAAKDYQNLTLSEDGTRLFYLVGGKLHCHALSGSYSYCTNTALGPIQELGTIARGGNQFTWGEDNELLISTYKGQVLSYKLPSK